MMLVRRLEINGIGLSVTSSIFFFFFKFQTQTKFDFIIKQDHMFKID